MDKQELFRFVQSRKILRNDKNRTAFQNAEFNGANADVPPPIQTRTKTRGERNGVAPLQNFDFFSSTSTTAPSGFNTTNYLATIILHLSSKWASTRTKMERVSGFDFLDKPRRNSAVRSEILFHGVDLFSQH